MTVDSEALARFEELLQQARDTDLKEPTAVSLATVGAAGMPSVRTVLLKQVDERGFVFYTNTRSRKGVQLAENPKAALCFFWQPLMEQVLVEGDVEPVSAAEADAYWASRPRLSQIGAWASHQSEPLARREELEQRLADYERRYADQDVPRPSHWSGYRLRPRLIEFWSARPGRLHDRVRYQLEGEHWRKQLVNP